MPLSPMLELRPYPLAAARVTQLNRLFVKCCGQG